MREIVFDSGDYSTLLSEAERLGFTQDGNIVVNGPMKSGGAYFLNIVGTIYEPFQGEIDPENPPALVSRPGYWGRLRINGDVNDLPVFAPSIEQYIYADKLKGWTADGKTLAPDYVENIGLIA